MFSMFFNFSKKQVQSQDSNISDFEYLPQSSYYFDSACQSLRPQSVIDAETEYYQKFNTCGHRVKYKWGEIVDKKVSETRDNLLKMAGKSSKDYTVAFCLNTTHGTNLVLQQIDPKTLDLKQIITSDIEHNSVFLTSLVFAKKFDLNRKVLERDDLGNLIYEKKDLEKSAVILNTMSNIDGRELLNLKQLTKDTHENGGILLLDACQTFGHNPEFLENVDFDAAFGSGHKMHGPSLGFIIIKKNLLKKLDCFLIGGSTVQDVKLDSFELIENDDEIYARLEAGLQNYAGIIGLNEAIKWRENWNLEINENSHIFLQTESKNKKLKATEYENLLSKYLNQKLQEIPNLKLLNPKSSPVVSVYCDKVDGHRLALYMSEAGIMCRSGYHCCHYYLKEKMKLPPLFRISLSLHNTPQEIDYLIEKMKVALG
jgi:selenocysteine lyase/cysteine desulfurase